MLHAMQFSLHHQDVHLDAPTNSHITVSVNTYVHPAASPIPRTHTCRLIDDALVAGMGMDRSRKGSKQWLSRLVVVGGWVGGNKAVALTSCGGGWVGDKETNSQWDQSTWLILSTQLRMPCPN